MIIHQARQNKSFSAQNEVCSVVDIILGGMILLVCPGQRMVFLLSLLSISIGGMNIAGGVI